MKRLVAMAMLMFGCIAGASNAYALERGTIAEDADSVTPLLNGQVAPKITLKMADGSPVSLQAVTMQKPSIVLFYRGGWCPYCNLTLRAWRYAWPDIEFVGGKLLALTPENPSHVQQTVQKNSVDFPVLHDIHSEVARHFGISVVLSNYMSAFYRSLGMNTSLRNADVVARLPLPATYIIDQQATVQYVFVEEDYTQRAEITDVLHALSHVPQEMVPSYG